MKELENKIYNLDGWMGHQIKLSKRSFLKEELGDICKFYLFAMIFSIPFIFFISEQFNIPVEPFKNNIIGNVSFASSVTIDAFNEPFWGVPHLTAYLFPITLILIIYYTIHMIIDYRKIFIKRMNEEAG